MRLFLSSQDFGHYADVAIKMAGENKKALFIKNAQDDKPQKERNLSNPQKQAMFEKAGFEFEMIDLRDYFGKESELKEKISEAGSFWSSGGNVFVLRRAFAQSGFDQLITNLLKEDRIMYGGWSAGAMVASPYLKGPDWSEEDKPNIVPTGYSKQPIFEGLNLVNFYIVPHFGSPLHGNSPNELKDYYDSHKLPRYVLTDGQVVIVDDNKIRFLK